MSSVSAINSARPWQRENTPRLITHAYQNIYEALSPDDTFHEQGVGRAGRGQRERSLLRRAPGKFF